MSNLTTLLVRLLISGSLLFTSLGLAFGEEMNPELRERAEAGLEWSNLAKGRAEFEVSDPSLLPSRLILAAKQTGCRIEQGIETDPVRFTKIGGKRLAIVFCHAIVGSHIVFDLSTLQRPRVVSFPFMKLPEGFGTTDRPGWITREKETSTADPEKKKKRKKDKKGSKQEKKSRKKHKHRKKKGSSRLEDNDQAQPAAADPQ